MGQYSDSTDGNGPLTLAIDSGSPLVSIALGAGRHLLAAAAFAGGSTSPALIGEVEKLLAERSLTPGRLERLIAARGPGSFTGLRVGLATALGLSQALDLPAVAVPTFDALARLGPRSGRVVAAIDALRGEWFVQVFDGRSRLALDEPRIVDPSGILDWRPCRVVLFNARDLASALGEHDGVELLEADPLAAVLLEIAAEPALAWEADTLTRPLYLRPPAASPSRAPTGL